MSRQVHLSLPLDAASVGHWTDRPQQRARFASSHWLVRRYGLFKGWSLLIIPFRGECARNSPSHAAPRCAL